MSITNTNISLRQTHMIETHQVGSDTREQLVSAALCPVLVPHQINLAGLTEAGPGFEFTRPNPAWGQLLACTGGSGWVWIDPVWERCGAGQVYVTPPHILHAYRADLLSSWSLCWLQFSGEWLQAEERPVLLLADPGPLATAVTGLHREAMQSPDVTLLTPWASLVHAYARRIVRPGGGDPRLRRLWERVGSDLAAPWTVDTLAQLAAVSPEHLRRLCRLHHAVSPMRHVAALRMRRAAALLAAESYTVESVARQVGYDNPYTFSTAFKRRMGAPPSEYRQGTRGAGRAPEHAKPQV